MHQNIGFDLGVTTLAQERDAADLPVTGRLPDWLNGRLLRAGPARFDVGGETYNHWFDGLSMLHRFRFDSGRVAYRNRYLKSKTYRDNMAAGAIRHGEFATTPRRGPIGRLKTLVSRDLSDNANVSVMPLGGSISALTETPTPLAFDPDTLATLEPLSFDDELAATTSTAHPLFDFTRREALNFTTAYGRQTYYNIYRLVAGSRRRELVRSLPVKRPGYMHSFAATPRYVILTEWPLTVHPLRLAVSGITATPFIDNFHWRPDAETRLLVVERASGRLVRETRAPAGFAFHHVNAWEEDDAIVMDLCQYDDASVIDCLRLPRMRAQGNDYPLPRLVRLRIDARGEVSSERLVDAPLELPGIFYRRCGMQPYRYVYGISTERTDTPFSALVKVDTETRDVSRWQAPHCYPGEPVFVPAPGGAAEDDGVVLSLVLDGSAGQSFLLALDAGDFRELARAQLPHAVPFGFHGLYLAR